MLIQTDPKISMGHGLNPPLSLTSPLNCSPLVLPLLILSLLLRFDCPATPPSSNFFIRSKFLSAMEDIIMSLRSRLDIISDEADRESAAAAEDYSKTNHKMSVGESVYQVIIQPLRKQCIVPFPRRVFIPWLTGTFVCDYLLQSETFEALKDHFVELLSMEPPEDASTLLEPEKQIPSLSTQSF